MHKTWPRQKSKKGAPHNRALTKNKQLIISINTLVSIAYDGITTDATDGLLETANQKLKNFTIRLPFNPDPVGRYAGIDVKTHIVYNENDSTIVATLTFNKTNRLFTFETTSTGIEALTLMYRFTEKVKTYLLYLLENYTETLQPYSILTVQFRINDKTYYAHVQNLLRRRWWCHYPDPNTNENIPEIIPKDKRSYLLHMTRQLYGHILTTRKLERLDKIKAELDGIEPTYKQIQARIREQREQLDEGNK